MLLRNKNKYYNQQFIFKKALLSKAFFLLKFGMPEYGIIVFVKGKGLREYASPMPSCARNKICVVDYVIALLAVLGDGYK